MFQSKESEARVILFALSMARENFLEFMSELEVINAINEKEDWGINSFILDIMELVTLFYEVCF